MGVDGKRQGREQTRYGAQYGPQGHPRPGFAHLILTPERVARHAAIFHHSAADFEHIPLVVAVRPFFVIVAGLDLELLRAHEPEIVVVHVHRVAGIVPGPRGVGIFTVLGRFDHTGLRRLRRGGNVLADTQLPVFREL